MRVKPVSKFRVILAIIIGLLVIAYTVGIVGAISLRNAKLMGFIWPLLV
jgi:hypothetical protein